MKYAAMAVFILLVSGCNLLGIQPDRIVCERMPAPSLPAPNSNGNVVLTEDDQQSLLLYIESLEHCIDKAYN